MASDSKSTTPWGETRPTRRSECIGRPRPCPWVGCRYNLALDISAAGTISAYTSSGDRGKQLHWPRRSRGELYPGFGGALSDALADVVASCDPARSCVLDVVEDGDTMTLSEVGEVFGVKREMIRLDQLRAERRYNKAWRKLLGSGDEP